MRLATATFFLIALPSCLGVGNGFSGDGDDGDGGDGDGETAEVFSLEEVHQIELTVPEDSLAQLVPHNEVRVPLDFVFDGEEVLEAGVRLKGGIGSVATLDQKPGFSIKFDSFVQDQRFRSMRRLVLNAFVQDRSMMSEHVGYEMYRRIGVPGPRTAYGWVTFNGEPYGLYLVTEAVNNDFTERNFGDNDGNLYEGECCGELAVGFTKLKNNGELTGDTSDLQALVDVMNNSPDETYVADVEAVVDLESFLRYWALEAMVTHWDGYNFNRNNFYLYHRPSDDRFMFLPHGLDQLFNNVDSNVEDGPGALLSQRLYALPEGRERYEAALRSVAEDGAWPVDELVAYLDAADALTREWVDQDPRKYQSTADQQGSVSNLRDYLTRRPGIVISTLDAVCGNGIQDTFEECDDENAVSEDGCSDQCRNEFCGDGILQPGLDEVCDGIGCRADCSGIAECGDGIVDVGEDCDDDNDVEDDGCTARCTEDVCGDWILQPSRGEVCDGPGCRPDCSAEGACGDGTLDVGEDCDDGDVDDGDACAGDCSFGDCQEEAGPGGGTWLFCSGRRTWTAARDRCAAYGLRLVVPTSPEENTYLFVQATPRNGGPWWIGIDDLATEGLWRTQDWAAPGYLPWGDDEPNGGERQNCGVIDPRFKGNWNDKECTEQYPMACR